MRLISLRFIMIKLYCFYINDESVSNTLKLEEKYSFNLIILTFNHSKYLFLLMVKVCKPLVGPS